MVSQSFGNSADLSSQDCSLATDLLERARAVNRCAPTQLYDFPQEPFDQCDIRVTPGRSVHVEQFGNPDGIPLIYIHGGLVMPMRPQAMGFLDPTRLRVVSLHQRGTEKSGPVGDLRELSIQYSAEDVEAAREALGIDTWHVYGHSFGASIALLYSSKNADKSRSLILQAGFFPGEQRTQAFYDLERSRIPDAYKARGAKFDASSDNELSKLFAQGILASDSPGREDLVRAYWGLPSGTAISARQLDYTQVLLWYRINDYFLPGDWLDQIVTQLGDREVSFLHSPEDEIVPIESSLALAARLPKAGLSLILGQHFYKGVEAQGSLRRVFDRLCLK